MADIVTINNNDTNHTVITNASIHWCKRILYEDIANSRLRYWDAIILVPNVLFMAFLLLRLKTTKQKLRQTTSPIFATFYLLVWINVITSLLRCIISMLINVTSPAGDITDKVFWVIVRFFLLSTETSVLVFGLAFGHLDSQTSIRRVLLVTSFISLAYSICQGCLEIISPDESFYIEEQEYYLFSHGGMIFWFCTCLIFAIVYIAVFLLPWTPCRQRIPLPSKQSFYIYTLILSILNLIQAIGSSLFFNGHIAGLCMVDVTTYIYFTLFTPLVFWTFLAQFFSQRQSVIMFSYKPQLDDNIDETANDSNGIGGNDVYDDDGCRHQLPHQLSCSSLRTDSDFVYQRSNNNNNNSDNSRLYESTQFTTSSTSSSVVTHADG
ncbi:transmembrane protein adipocyte-associated 1 homolog [Oppia nitens]|uniref:transmembrane protein adipocyte-associated 1 homolog n=1 Tax=Oppia nitens TaxID=1686743 RepID=UPI0023DBE333|nr:transmembrane protein adipocyte-associated 1 homolog [Oppia nitens]